MCLSPAASQQAVWYPDRLHPDTRPTIAFRFRLSGPLHPAVLGRALTAVSAPREALRAPEWAAEIVNAYLLSFFRRFLKSEEDGLIDCAPPS